MLRFLPLLLALLLVFSAPQPAQAQQITTGWLSSSEYQAFFDQRRYGSLVPLRVDGGLFDGHLRYQAVFGPNPGNVSGWFAHHGMTGSEFEVRAEILYSQGYVLVYEHAVTADGHEAFQGIWYHY